MPKRLLLIDGNNLAWRGWLAEPLTTSKGRRVEVIYLGLRMLKTYLDKFKPHMLYVVWDGGRDIRRKELLPSYKERVRTEEQKATATAVFEQMNGLRSLIQEMNLPTVRCRGREADDIISALAGKPWASPYSEVVVVSTDRDYFQLLTSSKVKLFVPSKNVIFSKKEAEAELGVPLERYPLYKALVGGHDALPGVPGVGPKRATQIILSDPDLEDVKFNREEVRQWARVSAFLPVPESEIREGLRVKKSHSGYLGWLRRVAKSFDELEFLSLQRDFLSSFWEYLERSGG